MRLPLGLLFVLFSYNSVLAVHHRSTHDTHNYYVLEHDARAGATLSEVARHLGVQVVDRVGELDNLWIVRIEKPKDTSTRDTDSVLASLETLRRQASSTLPARSPEALYVRHIDASVKHLARQELRQRVKRAPPPITPEGGHEYPTTSYVADHQEIRDPIFPEQWHLVNDKYPQHMMNVSGLWEMGITGEGVIAALVDDGLDFNSKDLADNFYAPGSYDYNDHEDLPLPKLFDDHHGTRCAGQIAAVRNDVCGVGIAYDSKVAGLRILSGPISDIDEAAALNNDFQETSIYSCSWGPPDDGKSMESPSYLIERAMVNGIQNGRNGKGSIFVFASGNGAQFGDQCNFDGYTNSIFSVTVAAIDYKGLHPPYSESCAANLVVAYSSGSGNHIVTTDINDKCSSAHGGTSAAAPNAVGVYTLALSVRPELTWRDIQHLTVRTAEVINPDDPDWETTAAGRQFSYKYGYGRLDGYAFVMAAKDWELVKPQTWIEKPAVQIEDGTCDVNGVMNGGQLIVPGGLESKITVTEEDVSKNGFDKLEHITVRVWIAHTRRGDVEVELLSPKGVKSILAARRRTDAADTGYPGWRFMTVKHWDESPLGEWTLRVGDVNSKGNSGRFLGWQISLFGSSVNRDQAKTYELSQYPILLPSLPPTQTSPEDPTQTKTHPKPTLPSDHGTAEGESTEPAFPTGDKGAGDEDIAQPTDEASPSEPSASATMTPTPDEGWFTGMSSLVSDQRWFFGAAALVVVFGLGVGTFFWPRARKRRTSAYRSLNNEEDVAMASLPRGAPRTKELYDAFGEASDDDDADEETRLRPGHMQDRGALEFHSGFLDDDDPQSAASPGPHRAYRDEPEEDEKQDKSVLSPGGSGSGSGSQDGSWEHASQIR
ncbi:kex protein [Amylostereum chailletii]|nr:kex protein [Amylostereum chailletii]